jgi:lipopolysaccharide/colanic/teichoic acid biosynthesis glycosyltransferase
LLGDHVCVESDAVIIGPSILCDNCTVRQGAVVDSSIIGAEVVVDQGQILRDTLCIAPKVGSATARAVPLHTGQAAGELVCSPGQGPFRTWPRFSYARCGKRIADVVAATIVLVLFAPVIPFIALAIKVNSKGPVFFRDKRQGLHGRLFNCIKFRTMRVGAADIQDKLRFVSEVDGPQFKMADDPRISAVGRFLRETYLDEIPQFFNVLLGQMSVVGPRPSPESENTLCPWWRDARLSVRPGISGLWQVYRTRKPFKDFQEWIYYDTKYVQELSPQLDLWICWRTLKKMVNNFIRQF